MTRPSLRPFSSRRRAGRTSLLLCAAVLPAGCFGGGGGGRGEPLAPVERTPELVQTRVDPRDAERDGGVRTLTRRGQGDDRVLDRNGVEQQVRVHPDGNRIVFVRERRQNVPSTRELVVATLDGSAPELALTRDDFRDERPTWAGGDRIVFSSDRGGSGMRLWEIQADGSDLALLVDDGVEATDPEWGEAEQTLYYAAFSGTGRFVLVAADGDGRNPRTLTDGGQSTGIAGGSGDREPSVSADGSRLVFVRDLGGGVTGLTGLDPREANPAVVSFGTGDGNVRRPRYGPGGERVFFAWSRPAVGMPGFRLWRTDETGFSLLQGDKRFDVNGLDVLPGLSAEPPIGPLDDLGVGGENIDDLFGTRVDGFRSFVEELDGMAFEITTVSSSGREIAGATFDVPLGVSNPLDIGTVRISISAALSPAGPSLDGALLRLSVNNPEAGRFDTLLEVEPSDTAVATHAVPVGGLAYVDRARRIRFNVVGDFPPGGEATLRIDQVRVELARVER